MTKLWFRAKRYGYGWYPSTAEGWLVLGVYLVLMFIPMLVLAVQKIDPDSLTWFPWMFLPYVFVLTVILLVICIKKGEKARWRWGGK